MSQRLVSVRNAGCMSPLPCLSPTTAQMRAQSVTDTRQMKRGFVTAKNAAISSRWISSQKGKELDLSVKNTLTYMESAPTRKVCIVPLERGVEHSGSGSSPAGLWVC